MIHSTTQLMRRSAVNAHLVGGMGHGRKPIDGQGAFTHEVERKPARLRVALELPLVKHDAPGHARLRISPNLDGRRSFHLTRVAAGQNVAQGRVARRQRCLVEPLHSVIDANPLKQVIRRSLIFDASPAFVSAVRFACFFRYRAARSGHNVGKRSQP